MSLDESLKKVKWQEFDLLKDNIGILSDLVITSYVINELPQEKRKDIIKKLYNSTKKLLIIIEPGTPDGFKNINEARELLINEGADIVSPCTHNNKCPLKDDWCNTSVRVSRSKIHKFLKMRRIII